jgi:uncharacterized protein (DUF2267 family)
MIDESMLTQLVRDRGLADDGRARRAILTTLAAFGAHVPSPEREALARALPLDFARAASVERYRGEGKVADLYRAVARAEQAQRGAGREHVQIVLGALGELLPEELEKRLERAVAPSIADLLQGVVRPEVEPPPYAHGQSLRHHTLAMGRPGSRHPISESPPPPPQSDSVAAENPHASTKLSSASGETQEREAESLATSRPRTDRTISESRD